MSKRSDGPVIVQSDMTLLLEVDSERYEEARSALTRFAELVKSPEHVHSYRLTALSIWNARAAGLAADEILAALSDLSRYPVPQNVLLEVEAHARRYGRIRLVRDEDALSLVTDDPEVDALLRSDERLRKLASPGMGDRRFRVAEGERGRLKLGLIEAGFPVADLGGYEDGEALELSLREESLSGQHFSLRHYQREAAEAFHCGGSREGGSGVVVLPCGGGKTIVGMACIEALQCSTLIVCTSVTAAKQWRDELLDKTTLEPDQIGLYHGGSKQIRPLTIATYQVLTHRDSRDAPMRHLALFDRRPWGLIVYDEVHLLPAPVFQVTASLQARRRLGLTATLVREDGKEHEVFALIGPKKVDLPWRELEAQGWVAKAVCTEVRVPLPPELRLPYLRTPTRRQHRMAAENPVKPAVVRQILDRHLGEPTLVMGMYVDQVEGIARALGIPSLVGSSSQRKRDRLLDEFRNGSIGTLAVSKIANFSIDLPEAAVAIQVSGTFGSRQEEAQRLGRILRPKAGHNQASFYSLVTEGTVEVEYAHRRQLFLCEQGYSYRIVSAGASSSSQGPIGVL